MEFFEVLEKRKSVRKFRREEVEDEKISKILECVLLAPSAGNLQSYAVYIVKKEVVKKALAAAAFGQSFIGDAPVVFVVCADRERAASVYGERGAKLYAVNDADIVSTYILLSSTALGLGSCWVGAFDEEEVRRILGLPDYLTPIAIIPVGYPEGEPLRPPRGRRPFIYI